MKTALRADGRIAESHAGHLLHEPWTVETGTGGFYRVYTPYWKAVRGRVVAGAVARKWLRERYGVDIRGYVAQIGPHKLAFKSWDAVRENSFFSPDPDAIERLEAFMDQLRRDGDSVGELVDRYLREQPDRWVQLVGNHEAHYLRRPVFAWPEQISGS